MKTQRKTKVYKWCGRDHQTALQVCHLCAVHVRNQLGLCNGADEHCEGDQKVKTVQHQNISKDSRE